AARQFVSVGQANRHAMNAARALGHFAARMEQSTAALRVCRHLRGLWPLCYGFIIVPKFIRDGIYSWIAANRYTWFGKKESCMIPTPEIRARFLN
ncbi:MAG: thiol-disulfide oxidoreductase DCC family protein, partial [Ferruginibacter sp.]